MSTTQRIVLDNQMFVRRHVDYSRRRAYRRERSAPARYRQPRMNQNRPHRVMSDVIIRSPATTTHTAKPPAPTPSPQPEPVKQPVATAETPEQKLTRGKPRPKTNFVFIGLAAVLFVVGFGTALLQLRTNGQVEKIAADTHVLSDSSDDAPPDETKPDDLSSYVVPPSHPRILSIPKLSINARVRRMGIDAQNQLQAPGNIHDTGWYEESAKPGDAGGAIVIDGHVHGPSQPGVFDGLKTLQSGDSIQLERGDGHMSTFTVVKSQSYGTGSVDMAAALTSAVPGKLGLNLITCDGPLDKSGNHYQQRLIVFAVETG